MKYVHIDFVETGDFLGKSIFSGVGTVLLAENVQLTVFMINTLKRIGVTMVYIKDPLFSDVVIEEVVSEENKRAVMQQISETFDSIRSGKEINTRKLSISVDRMLEDIVNNRDVLLHLSDIRTHDNANYVHALNVCTMSALMGIHLGLNQIQLKELCIGALLHDIGKVELITDDSSQDPRRHHTWRGFELLKAKREFSLLVSHVAFQHHEAPDGSGIPRNLGADQIHLYAKIVAVANVYDNLLDHLSKHKRMLPHEACEVMMTMSATKLDQQVLVEFLRTVSIYPTGTSVRLTTREIGVVVGQHVGLPGRPVIRVVKQEHNNEISVKEIDLMKHTTVFIEAVLV